MAKIKGGRVGSVKKLKASLKKGGGGAGFLTRVPSDGSLTVRFIEEPEEWVEYTEFWDPDAKRFYPLSDDGPQPRNDKDNRPSRKYLANAVDTSDNKVIPLVMSTTLAQSLMKKYDKYSTLLDRDYELVREGTGLDTTYEAIPEPPTKMNLDRFEPLDLLSVLESQLPSDVDDDDEEDDDEPVRRPSKKRTARKVSKRETPPDDDDDEDDEPPVRKVRKPVAKKPAPGKKTMGAKKPIRRR